MKMKDYSRLPITLARGKVIKDFFAQSDIKAEIVPVAGGEYHVHVFNRTCPVAYSCLRNMQDYKDIVDSYKGG
jgi:hypothetical protein